MVKENNSESVEPTTEKKSAAKKPAAKKTTDAAKKPAAKKTAVKKTDADAPVAEKAEAKKPAAKKPAAKKSDSKKGETAKAEPAKTAPVAVTATSMIFMAPDLPTPVIDKKRGRPVEEKKSNNTDGSDSHVRRRSRRREGELAEGEQLPPNTVVKVRTPREPKEPSNEPTRIKGSTRLEAKKQRRRDGRDAGRRRSNTITESEFLARREAVDRTMVVRSKDGKIQLGVLEDKILVEHYVAKASEASLIGNVYLGKVQNVLPSMEAAFVDIGRGRNAVLYSGEVDWELAETGNQPRRIELALKSGDTVLVQVTKDPVGQKGARLTSQVSLPGRYLVYVPNGSMNGISR
mgnify:FL=1